MKKLQKIIDDCQLEVAKTHMHPEVTINNLEEFNKLVKEQMKQRDIKDLVTSIKSSVEAALDGDYSSKPL